MKWAHKQKRQKGFTIVELLIVVVVIAILAAITIVSYNGIQNRAKMSSMQAEITSAMKKLELSKQTAGGGTQYPGDLLAAGVSSSSTNTLSYLPSNGSSYCLTVTNGQDSLYATNVAPKPQPGTCTVTDQLVSQWLMNSNANDATGNANGTVSGAALTTGHNGQANGAYQFNGTSSYIALPANSALNLTNNFSVSSWIKLDSNIGTSTWNDIYAGSVNDIGVGINVNSSGVGSLMITKVSAADAPRSTEPVAKEQWAHVVATFSGGTINYYLNGSPNGTVSSAMTFVASTKRIGSRMASGFFKGAIDDLRVYSKVLSADEVSVMYAGGAQ